MPITSRVLAIQIIVAVLAVVLNSSVGWATLNEQTIIDNKREWLSYGGNYTEQRFSELDQINHKNIDQLDLVWSQEFTTARGMEATPLVHNGVMYISTGWSHVYALDAKTGTPIWHFDAQVDKSLLVKTCCGPVNRGVALWQENETSPLRVYFGALDGRLIALDAATGTEAWSVQSTPTDGNYSVTGAPRIVKGKVIIGNGGAEFGVRGYVSAYNAIDGELAWRFYTTPGDRNKPQESPALEKALSTWSGDYWYKNGGGGGTVWDSIVYDPEFNLVYIGTGNGSPWNREIRSPGGGDNLYLSSIVAINADTGAYVWHYQVTPGENWDYTATQQIVLADIEIEGVTRKVLMQAPKNGFFYVLDRKTGELLAADAYARVTWASHIDMETGRPVETEAANYQKNGGSILWPAPFGAHNWQAMSFSKQTGLMYIPGQNIPGYYSPTQKVTYGVGRWNTGVDMYENREATSWVTAKATQDALMYGELIAWDPIKKQRAWVIRHPSPANGGLLSTAGGLVFQGVQDGSFSARDAETGKQLWQYQSDHAILASPISYEIDGEQYIAVAQGSGGGVMMAIGEHKTRKSVNQNRVLVFKLGRFNQTVTSNEHGYANILELGHEANTDEAVIETGEKLYERNCGFCHGLSAKANGINPDLRNMTESSHQSFVAIVYGGSLADKGMVGFYDRMSIDDVNAIHAYLDQQQTRLPEFRAMSFLQKIEYWIVYGGSKLGEQFPWFANISRDWTL